MYVRIFCFCVIATCTLAAPPTDVVPLEEHRPTVIPIISQSEELEPNGTYKFSYETGNGIKREEISYDKVIPRTRGAKGTDSNEGGEDDESDEIHVQQGSYSYTAPDGTLISVRYIADENGFQPVGDHIPRVPEPGQSSTSSNEKSSRALKAPDNVGASSVPALTARIGKDTSKPIEAVKTSAPPSGKPAATAVDSEATTKSAESEVTTRAADSAATTAAALVDNATTTAAGPAESEATTSAAPVESAASHESPTTPSDAAPPATPTGSPASPEAVTLNSAPSEGAATTTADEKILTTKPELTATEPASEQASTAATELAAPTTGTVLKEELGTQGVAAP